MVEYVRPYIDQTETEKLRTELKIGLNNIHEFLDQNKVAEKDHEGFEKTDSENVFWKRIR